MFHPGVFGTLLLETSAGGLYLLSFMNRFDRVSRTFYRLHGTLFLILSGLALFFMGPTTYTGLLSENYRHVGNLSILFLTAGILVLILYNVIVYFGNWKTSNPAPVRSSQLQRFSIFFPFHASSSRFFPIGLLHPKTFWSSFLSSVRPFCWELSFLP